MAKEVISKKLIDEISNSIPYLIKFPVKKFWVDYDESADVLYISFKRPQKASDSKMLENGILVRYRGREIVGITIMEASKR